MRETSLNEVIADDTPHPGERHVVARPQWPPIVRAHAVTGPDRQRDSHLRGGHAASLRNAAHEQDLDPADIQLLSLLAEGLPLDAVGRRLDLSDRTVRRRARALCDRIGVRAPIQAVAWAARRGLI